MRHRITVAAAGVLLGLVAPAATAGAATPPDPSRDDRTTAAQVAGASDLFPAEFTLTPVDAGAGYFLAQGTCPKPTSTIAYRWTGAPNGVGWGTVYVGHSGPFSLPLRMQAAAPGQTIAVTIRCMRYGTVIRKRLGTMEVVSGNALMAVPANSGTGRRIVYSVSAQQLWVLEADDTLVKSHLVSGRRLALDRNKRQTGTFEVFAKKAAACRRKCPHWLSFHEAYGGTIGFHQIPTNAKQLDSELGQPRSHGCVRQSEADAIWLWNWALLGDVVVVVP